MRHVTSLVALCVLTACLPGREAARLRTAPLADAYRWSSPAADGDTVNAAWYRAYGDPQLDSLVATALANNTDLAAAAGRLAEALGGLRSAGGALLPEVSATTGWTKSKQVLGNFGAISTDVLSQALSASWELDVFGRLRADRRAAVMSLAAAGYDVDDVRRTITGRVVRRWFDLIGLTERLRVTVSATASRVETLSLTESRARAGLSTDLDVDRARAAADEARAQEPSLRADIADAVGDLAVLCGIDVAAVDRIGTGARLQEKFPRVPRTGVPADLLRDRPDVRIAESRVRSAAAAVDAARAAMAPSLSLAGSVGQNRTNGSRAAGTWSFGPSLSLPVFSGAARGQLDQRRAIVLQREADWRGTVLSAAREVEVAFVRARETAIRATMLTATVDRYASIERLSVARWQAGQTDFRDVLDAQRTRLDAVQATIRERVALAQAVATLYQSLGGGSVREVLVVQPAR